jgi:hypothetical protein
MSSSHKRLSFSDTCDEVEFSDEHVTRAVKRMKTADGPCAYSVIIGNLVGEIVSDGDDSMDDAKKREIVSEFLTSFDNVDDLLPRFHSIRDRLASGCNVGMLPSTLVLEPWSLDAVDFIISMLE